ncbi:MAG TPA: AsmA family protein [Casimicrobiaceae bacterium]|nr:AsmA family protein [Casimicrobiaceae bacterium]
MKGAGTLRRRRRRYGAWIALGVVAVIALTIAFFDWNWLRGPVAGYLSERTGRAVAIEGNFSVELLRGPRIVAEAVSIGNAAWSSEPVMARAARVAVQIDLKSLWHRPLSLAEVGLERPRVLFEKSGDGKVNWDFAGGAGLPVIRTLSIDDGVIRYFDPAAQADLTLRVSTSAPGASGETPVAFSASGRLRKSPFTMEGSGASLLALENGDRPYRLDIRARAGSTRAHFDGTVVPARIDNVRGALELSGPDLSQLYPLIPVPLPWTPAYRLSGDLAHEAAVWNFRGFTGKVGASDLSGDFSLDNGGRRSRITADVVSRRLDYNDLGGFVGLPAGEPASGGQKSAAQKREAAQRSVSSRELPTKPYDLERLRAVDARVTFKGERFVTTDLPLDDVRAGLDLKQGVLTLEPLDFGVAGGHVVSRVTLDARADVIRARADVTVRDLEIKRIVPALRPPNGSAGKLEGRAVFSASGNSVARMLASSDGQAALMSRGGDASALAIVLTNLDLARAVPLLLTKRDEKAPIRCIVADLRADDGVVSSRSLVVDTAAEKIFGQGSVDFANEQYDVRLKAQSKKPSLLALRGPIVIDGTFKSPQVHPAIGQIVARVGSAVALGMLAPPAAILPLIDFGHATDADCDGLMREAMKDVGARAVDPAIAQGSPRSHRPG